MSKSSPPRLPPSRLVHPLTASVPRSSDPLEDTDETKPARPRARTITPVDESLAQVIRSLDESEEAAVPSEFKLALEAISLRARDERAYLQRRLAEAEADLEKRHPPPPRRFLSILKGAGIGTFVGALVFAANFLVARGDAAAMTRQRDEKLERLGAQLEKIQADTTSLRAQVTGHDVLLQVLSARMNASPHP